MQSVLLNLGLMCFPRSPQWQKSGDTAQDYHPGPDGLCPCSALAQQGGLLSWTGKRCQGGAARPCGAQPQLGGGEMHLRMAQESCWQPKHRAGALARSLCPSARDSCTRGSLATAHPAHLSPKLLPPSHSGTIKMHQTILALTNE